MCDALAVEATFEEVAVVEDLDEIRVLSMAMKWRHRPV